MRFLADENVPGPLVRALARAAHDVVWIREVSPGAPDRQVLDQAAADRRVLVTFDKDFGELARGAALPEGCGVILFRLPMPRPADIPRLAAIIDGRSDWAGRFSVIEPGRVRTRPLDV
jgi:hypothetical protein